MLILLSCAKTIGMPKRIPSHLTSTSPIFRKQSTKIALAASSCDIEELCGLLRINRKLAEENHRRWQHFFDEDSPTAPAALAYTGMVFKKLAPANFSADDWLYASEHLLITSFLYGLL